MESKPFYLSKTVILNLLVSIAGILGTFHLVPSLSDYVSAHTDMILTVLGMIGVGLRMLTKDKVQLS